MRQAYVHFVRSQSSKERFGRRKKFNCRHFVALMLAVLMILSSIPVGYAAATPRRAVLTAMEGSVLVQAAGQATAVPAHKGMELKSGDRIITGKDGTTEIRFDNGSISRISPNSRIDLKELSRKSGDGSETTVLDNKWGKVWNNAKDVAQKNSRFQVNTPSAVASVRGTDFMVGVGRGQGTTVRVYDGTVGVGPGPGDDVGDGGQGDEGEDGNERDGDEGGETLVGSFQQLDVGHGEDPPDDPGDLDYLDIDDWEKDNLVEDNPGAYIEVEVEAKTLLLEQAEEKLQEELKNLAALTKELELIAQKLAAETDPAKIAQLQSLQQQLQNELSNRQEIIKAIDQERQGLAEEKEKFSELKEKASELTPEELKEQAKAAREDDKARAAEREAEQRQLEEQRKAAEEAKRQAEQQAEELGLKEELEQAAGQVTDDDINKLAEELLGTEGSSGQTSQGDNTSDDSDTSGDDPQPTYYTLTVTVNPSEGGEVTVGGDIYDYAAGEQVSLRAIPSVGYEFVNWTEGDEVLSAEAEFTYSMPSNNVTITANFASTLPGPVQLIVAPYVLPWDYEGRLFFIEASETGTWQEGESLFIRVMQRPAVSGIPPSQPAMIDNQPVEPDIAEQSMDEMYFQLPSGLKAGAYVIEVTPAGKPQNVIAAGVFHVVAFAGGEGTVGEPYIVESPLQLDLVRYFLDAHFELGADIDLGVAPYNASPGWQPIGGYDGPFTGTFNGNGKIIRNLTIIRENELEAVGLFGKTQEAAIIDLIIENPAIAGNNSVGSLAGEACKTELSGIHVAAGNVTGNGNVGGLIGTIEECTVENSYALGNVTGVESVGGLCGFSNMGNITGTYAAGTVSGQDQVGGLVGTCKGGIISYNFAVNPQIVRLNANPLGEDFGRIVGTHEVGSELLYNYARYDMGEPFAGAFVEKYCDDKDGDDLYYWSLNDDGTLLPTIVASPIYAGYIDPEVKIVIVGDTFKEEAANLENWAIESGDAGLSDGTPPDIWRNNDYSVTLAFIGEVEPDTVIEIQALAGALSGNTASNVISVGPRWENVGTPGFSAGAADYINLKVGYDGLPYVAYSFNDQVCVQQYLINGNIWDAPKILENAYGVSDISLYADDYNGLYVAFSDSEGITVRKWNRYDYGWYPIGGSPAVEDTATDISLHAYYDTPYIAYITQSGELNVAVAEYVYNPDSGYDEWQWYPIGGGPVSADSATDVSLHVEFVDDEVTPYVAYSENDQVQVKRYDSEGWYDLCDPVIAGGTTDVSLYVDVDDYYWLIPYIAFREQGNIYVKGAFDGWSDVLDQNNETISVGSAGSLSFVGIPFGYYDNHPLLFVAYKDLADAGKAKVKGYIPHFTGYQFQGFRWKNIGGAISEGEADFISLDVLNNGAFYTLFVAFKDHANDDKVTVKMYQIPVPLS